MGEILKLITCFGILLLSNNRSVVHFCGCGVGGRVTKVVTFRERYKYMTPNLQYTNFPLVICAKPNYSTPLSYNKAWEIKQNSSLIIYRTDYNPFKSQFVVSGKTFKWKLQLKKNCNITLQSIKKQNRKLLLMENSRRSSLICWSCVTCLNIP